MRVINNVSLSFSLINFSTQIFHGRETLWVFVNMNHWSKRNIFSQFSCKGRPYSNDNLKVWTSSLYTSTWSSIIVITSFFFNRIQLSLISLDEHLLLFIRETLNVSLLLKQILSFLWSQIFEFIIKIHLSIHFLI